MERTTCAGRRVEVGLVTYSPAPIALSRLACVHRGHPQKENHLPYRIITQQDNAAFKGSGVREFQVDGRVYAFEEWCAAADSDGIEHDLIMVDEAVCGELRDD